jgi:hypothetical protein
MATKKLAAHTAPVEDESRADAQSCVRGARNIVELIAEQIGDEGSQLAANPAHAESCLWGVIRLLESAEQHLLGRAAA